jgi:hypothetical protein
VKKSLLLLIVLSFVLQGTMKTALVIRWKIWQTEITELYCVNKSKPEMQCNGQCHLAKQMRRIESEYEHSKRPFAPKNLKTADFLLFCEQYNTKATFNHSISDKTIKGGFYKIVKIRSAENELFRPPRQASDRDLA